MPTSLPKTLKRKDLKKCAEETTQNVTTAGELTIPPTLKSMRDLHDLNSLAQNMETLETFNKKKSALAYTVYDKCPWGRCEHLTCGTGGRQYRQVSCVNSRGRTVIDSKCDPTFKPAGGKLCVKACVSDDILLTPDVTYHGGENTGISYPPDTMDDAESNFQYSSSTSDVEWVVSQWSSCVLLPGSNACGRNSGVRTRNVTCEYKHRRQRVSASRCEADEPTPVSSQSCKLLCRQDCVVTSFSKWSNCDPSCRNTRRTRTREVVVPPLHQGAHCPELSEMEKCGNCTKTYTYKFSEWSACTPLKGSPHPAGIRSHHLIGYQTRDFSCLQNKGVLTIDSHCSQKLSMTLPVRHRPCVMPQDCEVSGWSSLAPFNVSCRGADGQVSYGFMVMTRQVIKLPLGDGLPCPSRLIEYVRVNDDDLSTLRPCKRAKWITSAWSICQSVPGYNNCLTGTQTRRAVCVEIGEDGVERPVDSERCLQPKPTLEQYCTMDCDWDCSVSQWSEWSVCLAGTCGSNRLRRSRSKRVEQATGKKYRIRETLTLPGPGGRPCLHLGETRMCTPQPCYRLNMTRGPCEATYGTCGSGTRSLKATCLDRSGKKVRDRFCYETLSSQNMWATWENCYVPCPDDCVLSEWTDWTQCPDPCQVQPGGKVTRTRKRNVLAYHRPGGDSEVCPDPQSLTEVDFCPYLEDCNIYRWEVSDWSPCTLDEQDSLHKCGRGIRTRAVKCVTGLNFPSLDSKCEPKIKPTSITNCTVFCPVDCRITEWSEWSSCGIDCLPVRARQIYRKKKRYRYILQYQENGGGACPADLEDSDDCNDLPICETFHWNTTEWSECILPPIYPMCGHGLKARNISCFSSTVQGSRILPISSCLENLGTMPSLTESCHVPCLSECEFTKWSSWSQCGPSCEGTRFRYRRPLEYSKKNPICKNNDYYPLDEHEECECDEGKPTLIGEWSDCIIQAQRNPHQFATMSFQSLQMLNTNGSMTVMDHANCGKGKKYKAISCHKIVPDKNGILRCEGSEYEEEDCELPCPVDCKMTPWSAWSQCDVGGVKCGSGLQQRDRRVATFPSNGGRKCPINDKDTEIQTKVCRRYCNYHLWKAGPWGACIPDNGRPCGMGKHTRAVSCQSINRDGTSATVEASHCDHEREPKTIKSCSLPCPGDCVMSEWSKWTQCKQPCNGQQMQTRQRDVLRLPPRHVTNQRCQPETEERLCERLKNCVEYSWEISPRTSCLISGGGGECGIGYAERYAICRNEILEAVDDYLCEEHGGSVTEPLVVSCQIPCDNDCLLSSWSDWSSCSTSCGLGQTTRAREVLQYPVGNGRKCPKRLDQSKPCYHKGCYTWRVTEWSKCKTQISACGSGVQERNVSCVSDSGRIVNSSKCALDPEKLVMQTTRNCHVPCPGECELSDWSAWSDCFISCEDFKQDFRKGIQARSRAILAKPVTGNPPCNQTLWYSRSCEATNCTEFRWKVDSWNKETSSRNVWCERNDGLVVVGGCNERLRPPSRLHCQSHTCVSPAVCKDTDTCECSEEGYTLKLLNTSAITCTMNTTTPLDGTALEDKTELGDEPNIWMYAVIAVCTVFVIAVTAALYNMCELFRTGPRPRRKGLGNGETASTTGTLNSAVSGVRVDKMASVSATGTPVSGRFRDDNIYKQLNSLPPSSHPSTHPSPSPSSHRHNDIPDADVAGSDVVAISITNPANSNAAATPSTATTGVTTNSSSINNTPTPPPPPPEAATHSSYAVGGDGRGEAINSGVAYVNSVRTLHNSSSTNIERMPSSLLRRDANRRYKRVHCLLPHRLALCFSCGNKSSVCMVEDEESSGASSMEMGQNLDPIAASRVQSMSLTRAHAIENMELCGGEFYTKTACGFQNHQCMLPPTYDYRPSNLDLQTTYFNDTESCHDHGQISGASDSFGPPLTAEIQQEIANISPDVAQELALESERMNEKEDETSSESIALSSELVSTKLEESSQCSLQLGDTAETFVSQNYPTHPAQSSLSLPLSTGSKTSMREQLLQHHQRTHQHTPYQPRSSSASPQPSKPQHRRSPNKRRRQIFPPPPSPSSYTQLQQQQQQQQQEQKRQLPANSSSPGSSSKFSKGSPGTGRSNKVKKPSDLMSSSHANSHPNPVLRRQDFRGSDVPRDYNMPNNNSPFYAPLHVEVPPLSPTQVEAMVDSDIPSPTPPLWQTPLSFPHPYPAHQHRHRQPSPSMSYHGKPSSSLTSLPSPMSVSTDIPSRSYHAPPQYHPPHHHHHHHHSHHHHHPQRHQHHAHSAATSKVGSRNESPPYPSAHSLSITPGSTSRSLISLPERPPSPLRHNMIDKTSQDSGHSTMSRSRTVSPGDFPGDHVTHKGQSSSLSRGGGHSPLRVQVSEESGHDSPTPSFCTSCRKELDPPSVPGLYLMGTPDTQSQASNLSGMETSV